MARQRKLALRFAALCSLSLPAFAQLASTSGTVNFGDIREDDGPKTVRTFVRNEGTDSVSIVQVRPTCGCTAANFEKVMMAPGDSAWIELTYNPYRRPGRFEKAVKVYPSSGEMIRIPIEGTVFASAETLDRIYPSDGGLLRLAESTLMPPNPVGCEKVTLYIDFYNPNDFAVVPSIETDGESISWESFPPEVSPGEKGMIGIYYDPLRESRSGRIEYVMTLRATSSIDATTSSTPISLYITK